MEEVTPYIGTAPQWVLVAIAVVGLFKVVPDLIKHIFDRKSAQESGWERECTTLREELRACQKQCDEDAKEFREEVKVLHEEIFGMRKQHITEQISLINVIMSSVDAPQLQTLLKTLESVKGALAHRRSEGERRVKG